MVDTDDREIGANVTESENNRYLDRIEVFKTWFDRNVISMAEEGTHGTILVLPYGDAVPKYRNYPHEYVLPMLACQIYLVMDLGTGD